jgi:hypothetical protein
MPEDFGLDGAAATLNEFNPYLPGLVLQRQSESIKSSIREAGKRAIILSRTAEQFERRLGAGDQQSYDAVFMSMSLTRFPEMLFDWYFQIKKDLTVELRPPPGGFLGDSADQYLSADKLSEDHLVDAAYRHYQMSHWFAVMRDIMYEQKGMTVTEEMRRMEDQEKLIPIFALSSRACVEVASQFYNAVPSLALRCMTKDLAGCGGERYPHPAIEVGNPELLVATSAIAHVARELGCEGVHRWLGMFSNDSFRLFNVAMEPLRQDAKRLGSAAKRAVDALGRSTYELRTVRRGLAKLNDRFSLHMEVSGHGKEKEEGRGRRLPKEEAPQQQEEDGSASG